jgi:tRNA 2-thiocytidine biosynthesis protein TtcA
MCSLCSRMRGALYRYASEQGITKIALGHHRDDIVETLFLTCFTAAGSRPWRRNSAPTMAGTWSSAHWPTSPSATSRAMPAGGRFRSFLQFVRLAAQPAAPRHQAHAQRLGARASRPHRGDFLLLRNVEPAHLADPELFDFAALVPDGA